MCGKNFKFMVFTFLENTVNLGIFTYAPVLHSELQEQQKKRVEKTIIFFIKIQS